MYETIYIYSRAFLPPPPPPQCFPSHFHYHLSSLQISLYSRILIPRLHTSHPSNLLNIFAFSVFFFLIFIPHFFHFLFFFLTFFNFLFSKFLHFQLFQFFLALSHIIAPVTSSHSIFHLSFHSSFHLTLQFSIFFTSTVSLHRLFQCASRFALHVPFQWHLHLVFPLFSPLQLFNFQFNKN